MVVARRGDGRFTPRDVQLGPEGDRYVQVLSGIEPGERVVTSAQFLIDSESNLREAVAEDDRGRRAEAGPLRDAAPC